MRRIWVPQLNLSSWFSRLLSPLFTLSLQMQVQASHSLLVDGSLTKAQFKCKCRLEQAVDWLSWRLKTCRGAEV